MQIKLKDNYDDYILILTAIKEHYQYKYFSTKELFDKINASIKETIFSQCIQEMIKKKYIQRINYGSRIYIKMITVDKRYRLNKQIKYDQIYELRKISMLNKLAS